METTYNIKKDIAAFVAEKHGVKSNYVRKVINGYTSLRSEKALAIVASYMEELERKQATLKHVSVTYNFNKVA